MTGGYNLSSNISFNYAVLTDSWVCSSVETVLFPGTDRMLVNDYSETRVVRITPTRRIPHQVSLILNSVSLIPNR